MLLPAVVAACAVTLSALATQPAWMLGVLIIGASCFFCIMLYGRSAAKAGHVTGALPLTLEDVDMERQGGAAVVGISLRLCAVRAIDIPKLEGNWRLHVACMELPGGDSATHWMTSPAFQPAPTGAWTWFEGDAWCDVLAFAGWSRDICFELGLYGPSEPSQTPLVKMATGRLVGSGELEVMDGVCQVVLEGAGACCTVQVAFRGTAAKGAALSQSGPKVALVVEPSCGWLITEARAESLGSSAQAAAAARVQRRSAASCLWESIDDPSNCGGCVLPGRFCLRLPCANKPATSSWSITQTDVSGVPSPVLFELHGGDCSRDDDADESVSKDELCPEGVHLMVVVPRVLGANEEVRHFRNHLSVVLPDARLMTICPPIAADMDLHRTGVRFAIELSARIRGELEGKPLARLSFACHSTGGLIVRAALPWMKEFANRLGCFITIGTPHLGLQPAGLPLVAWIWHLLRSMRASTLLARQLAVSEARFSQEALLFRLSREGDFARFRSVILVVAMDDWYIPQYSALATSLGAPAIRGVAPQAEADAASDCNLAAVANALQSAKNAGNGGPGAADDASHPLKEFPLWGIFWRIALLFVVLYFGVFAPGHMQYLPGVSWLKLSSKAWARIVRLSCLVVTCLVVKMKTTDQAKERVNEALAKIPHTPILSDGEVCSRMKKNLLDKVQPSRLVRIDVCRAWSSDLLLKLQGCCPGHTALLLDVSFLRSFCHAFAPLMRGPVLDNV